MNKNPTAEIEFLKRRIISDPRDPYFYFYVSQETGYCDAYFPHYHDYYEMSFYLGKEPARYFVGGKEYTVNQGDVVLYTIFEPHMFLVDENVGHERFNLGVDARMLMHLSNAEDSLFRLFDTSRKSYPVIHLDLWQFGKYAELINRLKNLDTAHGKGLTEKSIILQLLTYLYTDSYETGRGQSVDYKYIELVSQLKDYIESHLAEPITLDELAAKTNYSAAHLCRVFKKKTGETLIHYILDKRLQKAKELLTGSLPITEIAAQTGFNSYSYFYRAFKKSTGIGPEEYRKSIN